MSSDRPVLVLVASAAVGVALGVLAVRWLARRDEPESLALSGGAEPRRLSPEELFDDDAFPDSLASERIPVSEHYVTARPQRQARPALSGDDYDSISADDLGAAFLARATDSTSDDDEPSSLDGLRIVKID